MNSSHLDVNVVFQHAQVRDVQISDGLRRTRQASLTRSRWGAVPPVEDRSSTGSSSNPRGCTAVQYLVTRSIPSCLQPLARRGWPRRFITHCHATDPAREIRGHHWTESCCRVCSTCRCCLRHLCESLQAQQSQLHCRERTTPATIPRVPSGPAVSRLVEEGR